MDWPEDYLVSIRGTHDTINGKNLFSIFKFQDEKRKKGNIASYMDKNKSPVQLQVLNSVMKIPSLLDFVDIQPTTKLCQLGSTRSLILCRCDPTTASDFSSTKGKRCPTSSHTT